MGKLSILAVVVTLSMTTQGSAQSTDLSVAELSVAELSVAELSVAELSVTNAELAAVEPALPMQTNFRRRRGGIAMLSLGVALTVPSAVALMMYPTVNPDRGGYGTFHALMAAGGIALLTAGAIRLARTSRNDLGNRRRMRRRFLPFAIAIALLHGAVTATSILVAHEPTGGGWIAS